MRREPEPAQLPWPELPSDTGRRGASDPSLPDPAPSLFPVSVGETAAVGERMGVGEKQGEGGAENRSHILFSAAASSFLCRVGGGGLRGPAENPVMPNSRPLPFADPGRECWILSALRRLETRVRSQSHSAVPKIPSFQGSHLQLSGQREASLTILKLTSVSKLQNQKRLISNFSEFKKVTLKMGIMVNFMLPKFKKSY